MNNLLAWLNQYRDYCVLGLCFCFWSALFFRFFSSDFFFVSDAISYFHHIRFFLQNFIEHGYALWNPNWYEGAPNDFFLLRFNASNPLIFLPLIFSKLGIPFLLAYKIFLVLYFWLGMVGFFLLAKMLFKNRVAAFLAMGLLAFSSLGMRIVDTYLILICTPLYWFFYFGLSFIQLPRRAHFVGLIASMMILLGTYIPFYFILIVSFFLISLGIVYANHIPEALKRCVTFINAHKLLSLLGIIFIIAAVVPGFLFFKFSKDDIAMPKRTVQVEEGVQAANALHVDTTNALAWGISEEILLAQEQFHQGTFNWGYVYIPLLAYVCIALGFFTGIRRRFFVYLLFGGGLFLISTPSLSSFYTHATEHLFFMKYFRNLHFFLWLVLMPLFVLFAVEQAKNFWDEFQTDKSHKLRWGIMSLAIHICIGLWLWYVQDRFWGSYVSLGLSLLTCLIVILKSHKQALLLSGLLALAVLIQPMGVYQEFSQSLLAQKNSFIEDELQRVSPHFSLTRSYQLREIDKISQPEQSWYSTAHYQTLRSQVNDYALKHYIQTKFYWYDRYQIVDNHDLSQKDMDHYLETLENIAFLNGNHVANIVPLNETSRLKAQPIRKESKNFQLLKASPNKVSVKINIPQSQVLLYTDNYHPHWEAFIDGQKVELYRAQVAFKAVIVPEGEHVVTFVFQSSGLSLSHWIILLGCLGAMMLLVYWSKDEQSC